MLILRLQSISVIFVMLYGFDRLICLCFGGSGTTADAIKCNITKLIILASIMKRLMIR